MIDGNKFKALNEAVLDPENSERYISPRVINSRLHKTCSLDGCNHHLTLYKGPGSRVLCREHQVMLREYGGFARLDRPWTFWKNDHCEECGHHPVDNPIIMAMPEDVKHTIARMLLHVDHLDGDTNNNHPSNLHTKCAECHSIKTFINADYW